MGKRPRDITAPPETIPILEWYKEVHDTAFCILHPFVRVEPGFERLVQPDADLDVDPTREQLRAVSEPVSWEEVCQLLGLDDVGLLNLFLRGWIGLLREEPSDSRQAWEVLRRHGLLDPVFGEFSPYQLDSFVFSIAGLGYDKMIVGDEFGDEAIEYRPCDLICSESPFVNPAHPTLYTPDRSLLYASVVDAHFTILAGPRNVVERIVNDFRFEGFFCLPETKILWGGRFSRPGELHRPETETVSGTWNE